MIIYVVLILAGVHVKFRILGSFLIRLDMADCIKNILILYHLTNLLSCEWKVTHLPVLPNFYGNNFFMVKILSNSYDAFKNLCPSIIISEQGWLHWQHFGVDLLTILFNTTDTKKPKFCHSKMHSLIKTAKNCSKFFRKLDFILQKKNEIDK